MLLVCICHIFFNKYNIIPCTGANSDARIVDLFLRHLQRNVLRRLTDFTVGAIVVKLDVQLTTVKYGEINT